MTKKNTFSRLSILLLLLSFLPSSVLAVDRELYQGTVPVASYSSADFNKAATAALRQVLVKVSGDVEVVNVSAVQKALGKPESFIQSYNYSSASDTGKTQLSLIVRFSPKAVNKLLQPPQQSALSAKKTQTLVWLVEKNLQGQLQIVNDPSNPIVAAMEVEAQKQAIPLLWPVMDLQDISAVSPDQIWQLDQRMLKEASRRYQPNALLIGRIEQVAEGRWRGNWVWSAGEAIPEVWETDGNDPSVVAVAVLSKFMNTASNSTGEVALDEPDLMRMGQRHTASQNSEWVTIRVSGIHNLDDYAELVNYFKTLPFVLDVNASQMEGEHVTLRVNINQNQQVLVRALDASYQLVPDLYGTQDHSVSSALLYHWATRQLPSSMEQNPHASGRGQSFSKPSQDFPPIINDPLFQDGQSY